MVGRDRSPRRRPSTAEAARTRRKRATSKNNIRRRIQAPPLALTIAGSDSSAGAGIQADLKTFSALGVYGLIAVTCIVAEVPGKVSRIDPVSAAIVGEQIAVLAKNFRIGAMKTGLLFSVEIISAVAKAILGMEKDFAQRIPIVIDPVIVATSGDPLVEGAAIEAYEKQLFPLATLITPNIHEAEQFLGMEIKDQQTMHRAGKELERKFGTAVLLKGGHLRARDAVDLLFTSGKVVQFAAPFVRGVATHGTGCTYSAAITAGLASGLALDEAIGRAKEFVTESIRNYFQWGSVHALNHSM